MWEYKITDKLTLIFSKTNQYITEFPVCSERQRERAQKVYQFQTCQEFFKIEPTENKSNPYTCLSKLILIQQKHHKQHQKKWLNILCKLLSRQEEPNIQLHQICREPALKYKTILLACGKSAKIPKQCNTVSRSSAWT